MNLVINEATKSQIEQIALNMPQSILIAGPTGIGLSEIVNYIADLKKSKPLIILPEKDEKVDLEKGIIGVEIIRRLYDEVRTKSNSDHLIVIDYTEKMTVQAQNAFLKLLEEPTSGVYFILLSHTGDNLLPTVLSRVTLISVKPVSIQQSELLLDELAVTDQKNRAQILFLAEGLPAEITRLSTNADYFESRSAIMRDAKTILIGTDYEKLKIANKYKDDRNGALLLMTDVANMLKRSLKSNPDSSSVVMIDKILDACDKIRANANIRLCITRVVFSNLL